MTTMTTALFHTVDQQLFAVFAAWQQALPHMRKVSMYEALIKECDNDRDRIKYTAKRDLAQCSVNDVMTQYGVIDAVRALGNQIDAIA